ncbi:LysR family transcriptional regulator [Limosilactobacillus sp. c9Ua_26_M]|uniref:LysR family transcriptional regulator n=1 Tax=Limosilactobacillus urinaemulieris TaxID=2742600 RepID=A0ABR8ZLK0_9LACO|nr:LysR family transcriptional regulator [Limosilactobacillus urinaemulieris]MBD8085919.1 LysR family transcriptional regulator [Limosilactobacillus urinaemulieris]
MIIEQIKYFVVLANNKTITTAANQLHISQAGLSKAISLLEIELGFSLVQRSRQGTVLTKKGQAFLPLAKQFISSYNQMITGAQEIKTANKENIRIALANTTSFIEQNFINLQQSGVKLSLNMGEFPSSKIITLVKNGQFDIGLVAINRAAKKTLGNLKFKLIRKGSLRIYVKKDNPLLQHLISIKELHKLNFFLFEDEYNDHLFDVLQSRIGPLNVIFHGGSNDAVAKIADQLNGAILARDFQIELSDNPIFKKFLPINISPFLDSHFELGWIYRPNYHLSKNIIKLMTIK